jgi:hypothetical protein
MEMYYATESIYLGGPWVDRYHLIIQNTQHIFPSSLSHALLPSIHSISSNPSSHLKHHGVLDSFDSSDGTSYPLLENYHLPVAQATGWVAYLPPLLYSWYTHHQNDMCVTHFAGAAVIL